ncbi:hypothetical protein AVDCRST_MAG92-4228 [uncultured Coleofasciculus sp.]|uniref:Secreted protein n=1 Tax=uncultured Coleofasciculus sp. TaxID=1267456 RepID=A0A6J4JX20_9CYAN|nr:hypothetical protein AVDCRST_MAG92-4228 [uncultured Coleofasciculus sp.]
MLPPRKNAICLAAALAIAYYSTISANLMATHDVEKMLFFRPKIANTRKTLAPNQLCITQQKSILG